MKNIGTVIVSAIVSVGLMLAGYAFVVKPAILANKQAQSQSQSVGALTSPDIPSQYLSWGGVRHWAYSPAFNQGTSTLCAVQNTAATSTITSATAHFTAAIGYSTTWLFGISDTMNATTTPLGTALAVANPDRTGTVVATTTNTVVGPNQWVNFNLSTSTSGVGAAFAPQGYCYVSFREL